MEYYLGLIIPWPLSWAPQQFLLCQGQELKIADYTSLFALIGTTYGGDGANTFKLPDLRGRIPLGAGARSASESYELGQVGGKESVTLGASQMPVHSHNLTAEVKQKCSTGTGTQSIDPQSGFSSVVSNATILPYNNTPTAESYTAGYNIIVEESNQGGGLAHANMPPYRTINYMICYEGIWPSKP